MVLVTCCEWLAPLLSNPSMDPSGLLLFVLVIPAPNVGLGPPFPTPSILFGAALSLRDWQPLHGHVRQWVVKVPPTP